MKAEIIAVGTELLLGDILNTNSQFLARELANLGIDCYFQSVVGDNEKRLLDCIKIAFSRADMVILSGGLGPTQDDITKEVVAKYFGKNLVMEKNSLDKIVDYFSQRGYMAESNKKQALVIDGSIVFENNNGLAVGFGYEEDGKIAIVLPGPPKELMPMFKESVRSFLEKKQEYTILSREIHLSGIGESSASEKISDLIEKYENPTIAPYAKDNEMLFRVTAKGRNKEDCSEKLEKAIDEIVERLGEYIYGFDEETLESAVIKKAIEKGLTISTAESCTGGMVAARLVNYPGASKAFINGVITYTNESKHMLLGVKNETLSVYGAVSPQTAEEMCFGAARFSGTNIGISTTGIAGPDGGSKEKPVGLVYVGVAINGIVKVQRLNLKGSRNKIREATTTSVLELLRKELFKMED